MKPGHLFLLKLAAAIGVASFAGQATAQVINAGGVRAVGTVSFVTESASSRAPLVQLAGSQYVTMGLRSDGTVVSWGGQAAPGFPNGLTQVVAVECSFGGADGVALGKDGTLTYWGMRPEVFQTPANVPKVAQFSVGAGHIAAITPTGDVVCWDGGGYGALSDVPPGLKATKVSAGKQHTIALRPDGTIAQWGYFSKLPPSGLSGIVDISAGATHNAVLRSDGTVVCWGLSGTELVPPQGLSNVVGVAAGDRFSAALRSDGTVVAWGPTAPAVADLSGIVSMRRGDRQLYLTKSDGSIITRGPSGYGVTSFPNVEGRIIDTAAGADHSALLRLNGTVFCMGRNQYGQLNVPADLSDVTSVAVGGYFTAARKSDGTVVCWGRNDRGQCNVPVGLSDVVSLAAGLDFVVAVKTDGSVAAWGSNDTGVVSGAVAQSDIVKVAANPAGRYVLGLKNNGKVVVWGNKAGQKLQVPLDIQNVVNIAAGDRYAMVLRSDGTSTYWGSGYRSSPDPVVTYIGCGEGAYYIRANRSRLAVDHAPWVDIAGIASFTAGYAPVSLDPSATSSPLDFVSILALPSVVVSTSSYQAIRGTTVIGNVFLPKPAPAGGAKVTLVTDQVGVAIPGTIVVPAGERSVNFDVTVENGATLGVSKITATYNFYTSAATLTVVTSPLSAMTLPDTVYGKQQAMGTITLNAPAPAAYYVYLTSSDPNLKVPERVRVPENATSTTFTLTGADVTAPVSVTITAMDTAGTTLTGTTTVAPNVPVSLVFNPTSVIGGSTTTVTGTVSLAAPVATDRVVTLEVTAGGSSASVPTTVTIPAGSASGAFVVVHKNVLAKTLFTVAASRLGKTVSGTLTLNPNKLNSVTLSSGTVVGGSVSTVTGTVNLRAEVAQDTVISLASSNPSLVQVPSTVTVKAGQRSASFPVTHYEVASAAAVTISGTWQSDQPTVTLTVNPNPLLLFVTSRSSVIGDSATNVTMTIKRTAAVATDVEVSLSSSDPSVASVPAKLVIPAGQRQVTVSVSHYGVAEDRPVTFKATLGTSVLSLVLTVTKR